MNFDEAVKEITTAAKSGGTVTLMSHTGDIIQQNLPMWRADVALVQDEGYVLVEYPNVNACLRFRNNGQCAVEMK